jgi:hypothetical protein
MMGRETDHAALEVMRTLLKFHPYPSMVRMQDAPLSNAALCFAALGQEFCRDTLATFRATR